MIDETLYIEFDTVNKKLIVRGNAVPVGKVITLEHEDLEKIIYPTPERICPDHSMFDFYENQANDRLAMDYIYRLIAEYIPIELLTQDVVYVKDGVSYSDFKQSWLSDIVNSYKIIISYNVNEKTIRVINPIDETEDSITLTPHMMYGFAQKITGNDLAMYILRLISYMPGAEGVESGIWLNCKCQWKEGEAVEQIFNCGTDNEGLIALGKKISSCFNGDNDPIEMPDEPEDEEVSVCKPHIYPEHGWKKPEQEQK